MAFRDLISEAFDAVCDGYSPDRVVVDPQLNQAFINECRRKSLSDPAAELNHALLNLRKSGGWTGNRTTKRTSFLGEDDYRFASEAAVRHLERRTQLSIDRVLCDPNLAAEFDQLAERIAPGFAPVQYRWAALNLRKTRKLRPEILSRLMPSMSVRTAAVAGLRLETLPLTQGLYLFFDQQQALYAGETACLQRRIAKHLEHSDNKGLAHWLWEQGTTLLHLEWHEFDASTETRVRKALEAELIASRQPVFNVQCRGPSA